jgi:hypothetical protein
MNVRIVPSITTHSRIGNSWRSKIDEIAALGLKEVALFVTGLSEQEREDCYSALMAARKEHSFSIPFVHAVASMREDEFWFLQDSFGTEAFNLHPLWDFSLEHYLSDKVRELIFIENCSTHRELAEEDLEGFAGLCIDLSHLAESYTVNTEAFSSTVSLAESYPVGANHISAVQLRHESNGQLTPVISAHIASTPDDFLYLAALPPHCCASLCAIELENPLAEQLLYLPTITSFIEKSRKPQPSDDAPKS